MSKSYDFKQTPKEKNQTTKYKHGEFVKLPRDGLEEYFSGFEKNFTQIHT